VDCLSPNIRAAPLNEPAAMMALKLRNKSGLGVSVITMYDN
jgi:hypothetical protein